MIDQEGIKIELEAIDQDAQVMLVSVSGYVDQANCYLMQETIDKCLGDKFFRLVFDLQKLMYMSSAGWGVLIGEIKRFRENGGDIKLANMGPEIYEIYQMLEFYHIISEYPSAEDALKSFNIKSAEFSEEAPVEVVGVEEEQPVNEESIPEDENVEAELPVANQEETPVEQETEDATLSEEDLVEEDISEEDIPEEELVEEDASLTESPVAEEFSAEKSLDAEEATGEDEETIEEASVEEVEVDAEDNSIDEAADIEETLDEESGPEETFEEESEEKSEPEETPEPEEQVYYIEEDSIDELPVEEEKPEKPRRLKESAHLEKTPEKKDTSDDNPHIILEDEIDINIEGFLANEGIAVSGPRKNKSNYVEFNPDKYQRKFNIKVMPIPDKIRDIVGRNPELSPREIRNMLKHPDYGNVKISYFKFKSLLKALDLDTKQKRYRYYRSA